MGISVSAAVEAVTAHLEEPRHTVSQYARQLMDAGLLPKCRGRTIATINTTHLARLVLATLLAPKYSDTAKLVGQYWDMDAQNVPSGLRTKFGDQLVKSFEFLGSDPQKIMDEHRAVFTDIAREEIHQEIQTSRHIAEKEEFTLVLNRPSVTHRNGWGGATVYSSNSAGGSAARGAKRSVSISGAEIWSLIWELEPARLGIPHANEDEQEKFS